MSQEAGRPRARTRSVWVFNAGLAVAALMLYFGVVRGLPQRWGAIHLLFPVLAGAFCVTESWRVYIHFRRNAQSYSLSEITLIIGLFFATPDELLLARVAGTAVGLGLVRRHPPIKLVFNLVLFAIEAELAAILFSTLVPAHDIASPRSWLMVLLIVAACSLCGFMLSATAISLAEGSQQRRQWLQPMAIVLVGGAANASFGLEVVAAVSRNVLEMLLLVLPIATLLAAYALYTREHQKRQQLQYLYQSSDLLQRATTHRAAIPELLAQLCQVFRAEFAAITLLPAANGGDSGYSILMRRGSASERAETVRAELLDRFLVLIKEEQSGLIATSGHRDSAVQEWLDGEDLRDAMMTALQSDGSLLGALVVGNRLSDVSSFGSDDLALFETFAKQASVAVQNARLDNRLKHQAFHDPLTGLANRALFTDRLQHALTRRDRLQDSLAVVFLDLDDFKMINDSLGHAAGDELLVNVAGRLQTVLRPSDTAARFGGDEFAILLEEVGPGYDVIGVAERIVAVLHPHFMIGGREIAVHASLGVATGDSGPMPAEELLRRADVAMYRAKMKGKGTFEIFEQSMQEVVTRRLEVRTDLERAIERDELVLRYQPIVEMATGRPIGVEALVRWDHPHWGFVMPDEFINVAEETGLVNALGLNVLEQACRQCQEWQIAFPDQAAFSVSVNVSPRQLRNASFASDVWDVLRRTGMHPSRLVLEITESVMLEDPHHAGDRLRELKALGVRISMDDFGTGYSSLSVLQDLPLDILKIDKAFVTDVADDPRRAAFAQAIIRLGKTLGLRMVAEGVEHQAQIDRLRALGCELAQGYYYSRPVEAGEITRMLHDTTDAEQPHDAADDDEVLMLPVDRAGGRLATRIAAEGRRPA
ncbi:MAG: EAL domain-containing protein [Candidatus Dormibacteraeota bacterium]|nr:EAL domain-containing protein [Candidatus Dormibacteraeota bacterium]MBV9525149.1 EAL domain-containing protein [Candidatus Dormibacteraeota bacterium]